MQVSRLHLGFDFSPNLEVNYGQKELPVKKRYDHLSKGSVQTEHFNLLGRKR